MKLFDKKTNFFLFGVIILAIGIIISNSVINDYNPIEGLKHFENKTPSISVNKININDSSSKVTFNEAHSFMQNRCNSIGQTLMRSKSVNFNGTQLYMFLSVAENGDACISSVSENKLEVLAVDCGSPEMKVSDWNAFK